MSNFKAQISWFDKLTMVTLSIMFHPEPVEGCHLKFCSHPNTSLLSKRAPEQARSVLPSFYP